MSLSCSCDYDYDYKPGSWYYMGGSNDFIKSKYALVCQSCKRVILKDDLCISFERYTYPEDEEEAKECGFDDLEDAMEGEATIIMLDHYICEKCGEIYLNLDSVGFECILPFENMPEMLKEYQRDYAPPKLTLTQETT